MKETFKEYYSEAETDIIDKKIKTIDDKIKKLEEEIKNPPSRFGQVNKKARTTKLKKIEELKKQKDSFKSIYKK